MKVTLIAVTKPWATPDGPKTAEELMVYTARVSSPDNQGNHDTGERLLRYCMKHGHWSVFEQADMTVEIETSRAIAAQILRHRSFAFQEFSQRYSKADLGFEEVRPRRQDTQNRQASHDDLPEHVRNWFLGAVADVEEMSQGYYARALDAGIAKESARFLLPLSVRTRLYMKGSVRSWIHYLAVRDADGVQQEHREVAQAIRPLFASCFPLTAKAMEEA